MKNAHLSLDVIYPFPDNPNTHTPQDIANLAANIAEFGLINPIHVKRTGHDRYEIVVGHGRYAAYRKLRAEASGQKNIDKWSGIPCVVIEDSTPYTDAGRRLGENKLRNFNWVAECRSLAQMRGHGKTAGELARLFGYSISALEKSAALGFIPDLAKLSGRIKSDQDGDGNVTWLLATKHLLPLRIWPADVPKNDKALDYSQYDYSECVACIEQLVSGDLSPSELSDYSLERRAAILEMQHTAQVKSLAEKEIAAIKAELSEKKSEAARIQADSAEAIKKAQDKATRAEESAKAKLQKTLDEKEAKLAKLMADLENVGTDKAEAQKLIVELQRESDDLQQQLDEKNAEIAAMRETVANEIRAEILEETREQLKQEIQAAVDEEAEAEIAEARKISAEEMTKNSREKERLKKYHENLVAREAKLEDEIKRLQEQRDLDGKMLNLSGWIKEFNLRGEHFLEILEIANSNDYWASMGKPELKRIMSALSGIGDQLRIVENHFEGRGLLRGNAA